MIYLMLFWNFFQIGLFSIGGGYAALPLIQNRIVDVNNWLTMMEFTDLITISEMTPGPIAINSATFVGIQVAGTAGAVVSTLGFVAPSCIIVTLLAFMYYKYKEMTVIKGILAGLRPGVVALIASAGLSILILTLWGEQGITANLWGIDYISLCLFVIGLIVLKKYKPNPIYVIGGAGIIGILVYLIKTFVLLP
jgi:chromate transporter